MKNIVHYHPWHNDISATDPTVTPGSGQFNLTAAQQFEEQKCGGQPKIKCCAKMKKWQACITDAEGAAQALLSDDQQIINNKLNLVNASQLTGESTAQILGTGGTGTTTPMAASTASTASIAATPTTDPTSTIIVIVVILLLVGGGVYWYRNRATNVQETLPPS